MCTSLVWGHQSHTSSYHHLGLQMYSESDHTMRILMILLSVQPTGWRLATLCVHYKHSMSICMIVHFEEFGHGNKVLSTKWSCTKPHYIFVALSPTSYVAYYNACIVYIPTLLRNIIFCKGVERMGTPIAFLNALFAGETNYLLGKSFI